MRIWLDYVKMIEKGINPIRIGSNVSFMNI